MKRIRGMIDKVIRELRSENENGYYSHTIEALERIRAQFEEDKPKPAGKSNDHENDSSE